MAEFECLEGMAIYLNTSDECQTVKYFSPFSVSHSVCLSVTHTLTSPFLSSLSFSAEKFEASDSLLFSCELFNFHLPIVLSSVL